MDQSCWYLCFNKPQFSWPFFLFKFHYIFIEEEYNINPKFPFKMLLRNTIRPNMYKKHRTRFLTHPNEFKIYTEKGEKNYQSKLFQRKDCRETDWAKYFFCS